jgi:hypothetical protein
MPVQLARDELQTTMVAETNRKRRKLERDRRAAERPQPGALVQTSLQTLGITLTFEQYSAFPTFRTSTSSTRSQFHQRFMRSSTVKANVVRPPLVAAGRICRRLYACIRPFLHYLLVISRRISTISSIIDGRQSPQRRGTIRSPQLLPQWVSYSICPRTGVPQRRRQHLRPDDGIHPVPRAYSTNWTMVQGRSAVR